MRVFDLRPTMPPVEYMLPVAGSSIEVILRQQATLLVADLQSSTYTDHKYLVQEQALGSLVSVPLLTSQRPLGIISIAHSQTHTYTPTDSTLLQQIGTQVAIALENAHLFKATQQRAAFEESLSDITSRLQQQSDLRVMLEQTMRDLGRVLGANRARVQLRMMPHTNTPKAKE
ncbi:MAG: GAF domain-containing protein [Anaerolineae bacterium]|nr:GAF domain-containing protein [Anaerolineae bacterium]